MLKIVYNLNYNNLKYKRENKKLNIMIIIYKMIYPDKIIQQQPQEGTGLYFQNNFHQKDLIFNANIANQKSQLITSPYRQYNSDDIYNDIINSNKKNNKVKYGYNMEKERINNSEYNHYLNETKNPKGKIKRFSSRDNTTIIEPNIFNGYYSSNDNNINDNDYYSSKEDITERFNSLRNTNKTFQYLNNSVLFSPNNYSSRNTIVIDNK